MNKNTFSFHNYEEFKSKINEFEIDIPLTDDISILKSEIKIENTAIPNRLCIQPMEGCDSELDGSPGPLTFRKYERFAKGGSGIIWVEATAVEMGGKAGPRQLHINKKSAPNFKKLAEIIKKKSQNYKGKKQNPFLVLQLTHSGRYSKPKGKPMPIIFHHSPYLDTLHKIDSNYPLITDSELDELQGKYIVAAKLAQKCGYDAIDVKSCHGYLLHEILTAHTRQGSKYGGSFENRTRFLTELIKKIKKEVPGIIITTRVNIYDAIPFPYGWGVSKKRSCEPDLKEPLALIQILKKLGIKIINIAIGNPYYNPHIERPYDSSPTEKIYNEKHPLEIIAQNIKLTTEIAHKNPELAVINTSMTWLREFLPNVAAGMIKKGICHFVGLGRMAIAYPDFANDILSDRKLDAKKICITCSSCSQIMRDGGKVGCVIRDAKIYGPIFKKCRKASPVDGV